MRPDGIRVKNQDPMYELIPFFLPRRYDAQNMITIDIPNYSITLNVSEEEMAKRKAETTLKIKTNLTGYLKKYAKMVSSADKGAIIDI